jgi:6-phosphogluconolactonase (cycloisomerase 2 family)
MASYYNAIAHDGSPFITVYAQTGDTSVKLANPSTLPTGGARGVTWNNDASLLAVAHSTSPYVSVYSRSSDTLTKISDPSTLPTGTGREGAFSPDGSFLAVAHGTSPYLTIYSVTGSTLTKISNPSTLPTGAGLGVAWSPDGSFLAVAHLSSPYATIYSVSGSTFTKISNPSTLPPNTGINVSFSPDGSFLAVAHSTSPNVTIYSISGSTFTKISNPSTLPAGTGNGVAFSPDASLLAVAHNNSPYLTIYSISGSTFTKISNPGTLPGATGQAVSFSPDDGYLSVAFDSSPYALIYSISGSTFTKLADPASLPPDKGKGTAYSPASNVAPFAPTWVSPADNSYQNRDADLTLDWDFTDGDPGDSQSAYALSKSVDGATLEYWNASTSAWVAAEVKNPTANTFTTLASGWAVSGESVLFAAKTWDAADAAGPYGSGLTINAATANVPTIDAPATSAVLGSSSAVIEWTVAAQAAYQVRVLSSADAELFSTGKVTGAVTEITLGYVFTDGQTGLQVELTTWNAFDIPGLDTNSGISVSYTPPATPVLTVTANAAGYMSVAIADPTPAGSQPTVDTHDIFVRVAAGGRQVGERPVGGDGIRISTGTVETNGTYLDYAAATGTDFEYRTLAAADSKTTYSAWT